MASDPDVASRPTNTRRPLVLGASGRIGQGFRHLAQTGHWPGAQPLWQMRHLPEPPLSDALAWDILNAPLPDTGAIGGIIAFAGPTQGAMQQTTDLALKAIDLARMTGSGPVLLASSSAVYGNPNGPVAEDAATVPVNAYGAAKLAMEQAVLARIRMLGPAAPRVYILRIGNVAGADAILLAASRGPVTLDRFSGGQGPVRSYIGMVDLVRVLTGLMAYDAEGGPLPLILNVGAAIPVGMADLLGAANLPWNWRPAPATALARLTLDTSRLGALLPKIFVSGQPSDLIAQSRLAGWRPA